MGTEEENIRFKEIIDEANLSLHGENEIAAHENGNVYPGDFAPVAVTIRSNVKFLGMRWGFENSGKTVINARSETAREKPLFSRCLIESRCLVPCMGYYEWNPRKERFLFSDPNGEIIYMAGLYRMTASGEKQYTILTREAFGRYAEVHQRMPLIIGDRDTWLNDPGAATKLLASGGDVRLDMRCQTPQQLSMF